MWSPFVQLLAATPTIPDESPSFISFFLLSKMYCIPTPSAAPRAAPPLDIPPQRCYYNIALRGGIAVRGASDWVWRSLVACLNGVQEAGGSNPLTQTNENPQDIRSCGFFLHEWRVRLRPILRRAQRRQGPAHAATGPLFLPLFRRRPHACSMESPPEADRPPGVLPKNPVKYKGKTSISNIRCDILEKVTSYDSKGKENLNASLQKFCTVR